MHDGADEAAVGGEEGGGGAHHRVEVGDVVDGHRADHGVDGTGIGEREEGGLVGGVGDAEVDVEAGGLGVGAGYVDEARGDVGGDDAGAGAGHLTRELAVAAGQLDDALTGLEREETHLRGGDEDAMEVVAFGADVAVPEAGVGLPDASDLGGIGSRRSGGHLGVGRRGVVLHEGLHLAGVLGRLEQADEVERHVDAGGDAGGGDDVAVVHPAALLDDLDVAAEVAQLLLGAPVRGGALALEEAGAVAGAWRRCRRT